MQRATKRNMQQNELRALALRVLERSGRNTPCNEDATTPKKECNKVTEIRAEKLRDVASQIIDVSFEIGTEPEVGLGFFNALDWQQLADGQLDLSDLKKLVEYARRIHAQTKAGVRLVDVSEIATVSSVTPESRLH